MLTWNLGFFNISFLGGSLGFWGILFTEGMSEQQLFGNSSSILSPPCIEVFSPFQERTFGLFFDHISVHATFFRCLDVFISEVKWWLQLFWHGWGAGREHTPWAGSPGLLEEPGTAALTAGVVSVGSLRKENCLKWCCYYHCHHYCYYMPLETTIYASSHG